jgi:hypothetical protein
VSTIGDGTPFGGWFFPGSTLKTLAPILPSLPLGSVETVVVGRIPTYLYNTSLDYGGLYVAGGMETHIGKFPSIFTTAPAEDSGATPIGRLQYYNAACQENTQAYKEIHLFEGRGPVSQGLPENMPWISKKLVRFIDRVIAETHHNGDDRKTIEEVVGSTPRPKVQKYYGRKSNKFTSVNIEDVSPEEVVASLNEARRAMYPAHAAAGLLDD